MTDIESFCKSIKPGELRLAVCLSNQLAEEEKGNVEGAPCRSVRALAVPVGALPSAANPWPQAAPPGCALAASAVTIAASGPGSSAGLTCALPPQARS